MRRLILPIFLCVALCACAAVTPAQTAVADPQATGFDSFIAGVRNDAAASGIGPRGLAALNTVYFEPSIVALDQKQPETTITFARYATSTLTPARITRGRALMAEHAELLNRIGNAYGVPPRFIVALWAKETDFGRNTGGENVIDALATLAYEGRRATFFRSELMQALRIVDRGDVTADAMQGSWAGAMGQCQFMPSSFFKYGADGDGDGRVDIWGDLADVFASTANYLHTEGWDPTLGWGREVRLTRALDPALVGLDKTKLHLSEWQRMGVRTLDGGNLPSRDIAASLIQPDGDGGRVFLVYDNFRVIMHWNKSTYFATSIGLLADAFGENP